MSTTASGWRQGPRPFLPGVALQFSAVARRGRAALSVPTGQRSICSPITLFLACFLNRDARGRSIGSVTSTAADLPTCDDGAGDPGRAHGTDSVAGTAG